MSKLSTKLRFQYIFFFLSDTIKSLSSLNKYQHIYFMIFAVIGTVAHHLPLAFANTSRLRYYFWIDWLMHFSFSYLFQTENITARIHFIDNSKMKTTIQTGKLIIGKSINFEWAFVKQMVRMHSMSIALIQLSVLIVTVIVYFYEMLTDRVSPNQLFTGKYFTSQ